MNQDISQFYGKYRGVSPTDESAIRMGELEITIGKENVCYRMATGLRIQEEQVPAEFTPLSREQVASNFIPGAKYAEKVVGYDLNGLNFLFSPNAGFREFGLIVRGNEMADLLGPTMLYSPRQLQRGAWQVFLTALTLGGGFNKLPRLKYNGRVRE